MHPVLEAADAIRVPTGRQPVRVQPDRHDSPPVRSAVLFGLVVYEGRNRVPARVVVAFPHQSDADEHARREHLDDYTVVPLAFLSVDPPPGPGLRRLR